MPAWIICPAGLNGITHGWMVGKSASTFEMVHFCEALRDRTRLMQTDSVL